MYNIIVPTINEVASTPYYYTEDGQVLLLRRIKVTFAAMVNIMQLHAYPIEL